MSFERSIYDQGAYCTDLKQSTAPLKYMLDPTYANQCSPCRPGDVGYIARQGVSLTKNANLVDVESDLLLLNYPLSRNPAAKYSPCAGPNYSGNLMHFNECAIGTDYSRITQPPCSLRGTGVNRFQPICLDPQDESRWLMPSQVGVSYRLVVKDNQVPLIPDVLSPTKQNPELNPVLPRPGPSCLPQIILQPIPQCVKDFSHPLYTDYWAPNVTC
jgi:hypothetical protein